MEFLELSLLWVMYVSWSSRIIIVFLATPLNYAHVGSCLTKLTTRKLHCLQVSNYCANRDISNLISWYWAGRRCQNHATVSKFDYTHWSLPENVHTLDPRQKSGARKPSEKARWSQCMMFEPLIFFQYFGKVRFHGESGNMSDNELIWLNNNTGFQDSLPSVFTQVPGSEVASDQSEPVFRFYWSRHVELPQICHLTSLGSQESKAIGSACEATKSH